MTFKPIPSSNELPELQRCFRLLSQQSSQPVSATPAQTIALSGGSSIGSSAVTTNHGSLIGRDLPGQHPASAITNTPYGNVTAIDVQSAINQEDSNLTAHVTTLYTAHGMPSWTGNLYISSVGTITHGTWNGSAIQDSYIASAATWNAKQAHYVNLDSIGALANAAGWLHNNGSGTFAYSTPTKSDVGLGNVENTALSTWPGTTNITTLGTVTTGTWHGTAIADSYIASASYWNSLTTFPGFSSSSPANLGTASTGTSPYASHHDHVHHMPSYTDVGALGASQQAVDSAELGGHLPSYFAVSNATTYIGTTQVALGAPSGTYTSLSVNITGNVTGNVSGSSGSCTGNSATVTGLSVTSGKTLTVSNSLTLSGTDGSTLNIGTGGTLASGAFVAAYVLPTATSSILGGVKPDGTSILNTAGAISATAASVGALASGGTAVNSAELGGQLPSYYYPASNPNGYITISSVPTAYTSVPAPDGVGSAGTSANWSKGDHVHPQNAVTYTGVYYDPSALAYELSLSYNGGTRTLTLTPSGSTFRIWVQGVLYVLTGAQTITHSNTSGTWYLYYDSTGTLQASQTPWNILNVAPIFALVFNATTGDYLPLFECHHFDNPPEVHAQDHLRTGTFDVFPATDFAAAAYTLGQKNDAGMQLSISSGTIRDEDIQYTISAVASGGPYKVWAKIGSSGFIQLAAPTGSTNAGVLPFIWNTSTGYIQYNRFTGSTWQMTDVGDGNYVNYYVFQCLSLESAKQMLFIPGQAIFATLALAQAELSTAVNFLAGILPEFTLSHQLTFLASKHNSNNGMCSLAAVTRQILSGRGIVQGGTSLGVGGDLAGSTGAAEVIGVLGSPLAALATGMPYWNGSAWAWSTISSSNPSMDGSASPGSGTALSLYNHVHPVDTSRAAVNADTTGSAGSLKCTVSAGNLTVDGPTVTRLMTCPDAAFSVARIDAAQNFIGSNTFDTSTACIDSVNHRFGCGTATPGTTCHISKSSAGNSSIVFIENTATTDGAYLSLTSIGTTTGTGGNTGQNFGSIRYFIDTHNNATKAGHFEFVVYSAGAASTFVMGNTGIFTAPGGIIGGLKSVSAGGILTVEGPTVTRLMTCPDAAFSVARIDASQEFRELQTFTRYTSGDGCPIRLRSDTGGTGFQLIPVSSASTKYNWQMEANISADQALTISVSSAAGGTSFSVPMFRLFAAGGITFPSILTTSSAANAYLDGTNGLYRSTSSLIYKEDVEDMTQEAANAVVFGFRAVYYRSKCKADQLPPPGNPEARRSYYGGIAEELALIDPRFVNFKDDAPDGIGYDRLTVPLIKVVQNQEKRIAALETQISELLSKLGGDDI